LLKSSIDYDPFELTIEEKIFRSLKRLCTIFAAGAITLGVLDITNIRSVDAAVEFLHDSSARLIDLPDHVGDLPDRIRTEIRNISILPPELPASLEAQATAVIPRIAPKAAQARPVVLASADVAALPQTDRETTSAVAKYTGASPVAELAAARNQDAVEMAMMPPAAAPKPATPVLDIPKIDAPAALAQASVPADQAPVQLAAAEPNAPAELALAPQPVSLPMSNVIPLDMVPLPRPAPGPPPPSPAERLHLDGKAYAKAERCLANAVYYESRSEPVRGQMGVAQVVMNRVFSGFYPNDVCGVVYQNADHHLACQFTFACDGKRKLINERGAWARANRIAKETLDGQIYVPEVGKSTHYHAVYVHPNWVREMHKIVRYGIHAFYRPIAWGNGAEEPVWGTAAVAQNKTK